MAGAGIGEDRANEFISFTRKCVVIDLDTEIALSASDFSLRLKLSAADAVIYATTRTLGAMLVTCDAHFANLDDVVFLPKTLN